MPSTTSAPIHLPRVAITYCTQCKWMLRAAYFGQELMSTFGTQIGEIALIPATGGLFTVELTHIPSSTAKGEADGEVEEEMEKVLLWDRKAEGGFPETKVLKQLVRDRIDPKRDLGHSDKGGKAGKDERDKARNEAKAEEQKEDKSENADVKRNADGTICEDCR